MNKFTENHLNINYSYAYLTKIIAVYRKFLTSDIGKPNKLFKEAKFIYDRHIMVYSRKLYTT